MGYPTKVQCIQRKDTAQYYINFPAPIAQAMDFAKGETLHEWEVLFDWPEDWPEAARQPFDAFHARTAPSDWLEGLVKAYVGDGIATDFYREVSAYLDASTRDLARDLREVRDSLTRPGSSSGRVRSSPLARCRGSRAGRIAAAQAA